MTITASTAGSPIRYMGADGVFDSITASTATSDVSLSTAVSVIRFQTATNAATTGQYFLASGEQGQVITAVCTATANVRIVLQGGTATGRSVFGDAGDNETYRYMGASWYLIAGNGPTIATTT